MIFGQETEEIKREYQLRENVMVKIEETESFEGKVRMEDGRDMKSMSKSVQGYCPGNRKLFRYNEMVAQKKKF